MRAGRGAGPQTSRIWPYSRPCPAYRPIGQWWRSCPRDDAAESPVLSYAGSQMGLHRCMNAYTLCHPRWPLAQHFHGVFSPFLSLAAGAIPSSRAAAVNSCGSVAEHRCDFVCHCGDCSDENQCGGCL